MNNYNKILQNKNAYKIKNCKTVFSNYKYKFNKNLQNEKNNNVTETYDSNNTTVYNANENDLHYLHLNGTKFSNHKFLKGNTLF